MPVRLGNIQIFLLHIVFPDLQDERMAMQMQQQKRHDGLR